MMLSVKQKQFIHLFVIGGEFDVRAACDPIGVRPTEAWQWFREPEFKAAVRAAEGAMLETLGYGPLRVVRDVLAIAHSDIGAVQALDGNLASVPIEIRRTIKKIKFGVAIGSDGRAIPYPKEVEMHDKAWALKQAAEWYGVADAPEVKAAQVTKGEGGPKRITGLVIRPPLTAEDKDVEDMLK